MVWQWFTGAEFETAKHSRLSDRQESDGDMDAQRCRVKSSGRGRDSGEAGMPESTCEGIPKEKPVVGNQARAAVSKGRSQVLHIAWWHPLWNCTLIPVTNHSKVQCVLIHGGGACAHPVGFYSTKEIHTTPESLSVDGILHAAWPWFKETAHVTSRESSWDPGNQTRLVWSVSN